MTAPAGVRKERPYTMHAIVGACSQAIRTNPPRMARINADRRPHHPTVILSRAKNPRRSRLAAGKPLGPSHGSG